MCRISGLYRFSCWPRGVTQRNKWIYTQIHTYTREIRNILDRLLAASGFWLSNEVGMSKLKYREFVQFLSVNLISWKKLHTQFFLARHIQNHALVSFFFKKSKIKLLNEIIEGQINHPHSSFQTSVSGRENIRKTLITTVCEKIFETC